MRTRASLAAIAMVAGAAASAEPAEMPVLRWVLAAPQEADAGAAEIRARAAHALLQIRLTQPSGAPPERMTAAIGTSPPSSALFERGAAALHGAGAIRHAPGAVPRATREAERRLGAWRLALEICGAHDGTLNAAAPAERITLERRLAEATGIPDRQASAILAQTCLDRDAAAAAIGAAEGSFDDLRDALARQEGALEKGIEESADKLKEAKPGAEARAAETVETAIAEARKLTPELMKTVDALERLGVIDEAQVELKKGITRFDGALAMIEGGLAFASGSPTGLFQIIQGLADLVAPEVEQEDATVTALMRLDNRAGEAGRRLDQVRATVNRLRHDMADAFRRQERDIELLRQSLTTLVANASFQDFESCVLVEDVLRGGARLQVAAAGAGEITLRIGSDWPRRLRTLGGDVVDAPTDRPPTLLRDCIRSMLRLFGTDQAASVSKPFLVPEAADAVHPAARRHDLFARTLLAEASGTAGRSISPHGLLDYVEAVRWVDHPLEAAWHWRRAVAGQHVGAPIHPVDGTRLPQRQRIDVDRLQAVARVVLYLAPILWDDRFAPAAASTTPGEHPGVRVLIHLADLLDRALLDVAIVEGFAAVPSVVTLHRRLVTEFVRRYDLAAAARAGIPTHSAGDVRRTAEAELDRLDREAEAARIAVLELEAVAGSSDRHARLIVEFALHRSEIGPPSAASAAPSASQGPPESLAHLRLASAWRIGLSGEAIARGSRHWRDPAGEAHDVYREVLERSPFGWQLTHPAIRDALYDPSICRAADGGGPPAWLSTSSHREEVRGLCDRLVARATGGSRLAWFSGRPVEIPRFDSSGPSRGGGQVEAVRRLANEARTMLLLAKASVIVDGTERPLVVSRP